MVDQSSHEGGAVKARPYRCRRQSGQEAVLPHRRMFPRRRALPHQSGSRRLTGPRAEPQLLFCFINQSLLMLALWSCGRRAASSKRSGKSTGFCGPRAPRSNPWLEPIHRLRLCCPQNLTSGRRSQSGWHHNPSFWRSSGSGGWIHTVYRHIAAIVCDGPPARIQRG